MASAKSPTTATELSSAAATTNGSDGGASQGVAPPPGKVFGMMREVEGVQLPSKVKGKVTSMQEHVRQIRDMTLRQDDIFFCAFPKAGTHWVWEVTCMLLQRSTQYQDRPKEQMMMEIIDVEVLDQQPSPRILNSHLQFCMLPVKEIKMKKTKVVHVYRNPKDVLVSMYFMFKSSNMAAQQADLDINTFAQAFFSKETGPYGGYFPYLRQMSEFQKANPDVPFFNLSYEDMKKDPVSNIRRLGEFLQVEASDKLCEDIAQACSFSNMKNNDKQRGAIQHGSDDAVEGKTHERRGGVVMYRKGVTGDWKNHVTVALNERLDAMIEEESKDIPFKLTFT